MATQRLLGGRRGLLDRRLRLALRAALALAAVGLISSGLSPNRATELTYWDGASADEPGYAEEAANQIEDGTYAAHVGFFERPGYWNNRAVSDQGESEMDARMFSDASSRKTWETAGTDFMDTDSLYSESQDDMDDMMGSEYGNSWPGTGSNIYGWEDLAEDSDGYDGQWPMQPLDMEATDDAAVSQNDFAGYKAVGAARLQTLADCDACDSGADCVSGCRVSSVQVRGRNRGQSSVRLDQTQKAKLKKDDQEMADLDQILHPQNRFLVKKLVQKVLKTGGQEAMIQAHAAHTGSRAGKLATRQMKRMASLAGAKQDEEADDGEDDEGDEQVEQSPGDGWFLGCNPGVGFSDCLRQSVRAVSQELTPEVKPFYNKRQMNAGCKTGPGFSGCIVDNLDLDQPNYQKYGYWPILDDANTDYLRDDAGMNVDSWWDSKADGGASIGTFTERRNSKSAQDDYAMKSKTQSLLFVPGVGIVARHSSRAAPSASGGATLAAPAKATQTGEQREVLSAADAALASAAQQLSVEAAQKQQLVLQAHKLAQKQAMLRKLEGKRVIEDLNADTALSHKQQHNMLVQLLHRQLTDKNFKTSGYVPFMGNSQALQAKGINVNSQQLLARDMNFKRKGYWPLNGNTKSL